jgi:hypothetical protein
MVNSRQIFLAVFVPLLAACSSLNPLPEQQARCDLRPKADQCTDWREFKGVSLVTQQSVCTTLTQAKGGGTYTADQVCDLTNSWGGCQTTSADGSKQTNWYYKGDKYKTIEDAKKECAGDQSFVGP